MLPVTNNARRWALNFAQSIGLVIVLVVLALFVKFLPDRKGVEQQAKSSLGQRERLVVSKLGGPSLIVNRGDASDKFKLLQAGERAYIYSTDTRLIWIIFSSEGRVTRVENTSSL